MRLLLQKVVKIVGPAVVVAVLPIIIADYVLSHHALSIGRLETRAVAETLLDQAEKVTGEALDLLQDLRADRHTSCSIEDRTAFGRAAFSSRHVQQAGLVDAGGVFLCGEPMGALVQPVRLPSVSAGDPSVMIGILTDGAKDRQAVVTLKAGEGERLVARVSRAALDSVGGAAVLQGRMEASVALEDGSLWFAMAGSWRAASEPDAIMETITSRRFPIKVVAFASARAAMDTVAPLRTIVVVVSIFTGFVVLAVGLITAWRSDGGDTVLTAVKRREFVPYYQPVVDLFTGKILGCEVLVRWERPDGTTVPPGQFLPYAEATGLIRDITRQLMEKTVTDIGAIYAADPELKLSINLTASHFNDLEIFEDVRRIYETGGVAYSQLCFEVTEQHPLKDLVLARMIIGRLKGLGASVALDDVGTGHGGLAYLQKLGVDILKIDKMFIDDIGTDPSAQTIVDTLVELANQLGLGIVAEGVERQDQAEHLRSVGVSTAQGYLFYPPLPAARFIEVLSRRSSMSTADLDGGELQADAMFADADAAGGDRAAA